MIVAPLRWKIEGGHEFEPMREVPLSSSVSMACTLTFTKPRKTFPGAGAVVKANSRGVAMISVGTGVESVGQFTPRIASNIFVSLSVVVCLARYGRFLNFRSSELGVGRASKSGGF